MAKKSNSPITKSANPEPKDKSSNDWIIWAAWADRITFEFRGQPAGVGGCVA